MAKIYYIRAEDKSILATVAVARSADGKICRGMAIVGSDDPNITKKIGRDKALGRLTSALNKKVTKAAINMNLPPACILRCVKEFDDMAPYKVAYDVEPTAFEEALLD